MEKKKLTVVSVNISEEKGTIKKPVDRIELTGTGCAGDAHAGSWHRQVSLLAKESIEKFSEQANRKIEWGEFAENITTEGFELYHTAPLDMIYNDNITMEVTQIGKKCHGDNCAIFREVGNCVMPKEGIFARVIRNGKLSAGDSLIYEPKVFRILIITLSDRASAGEYADKSGPAIREMTEQFFTMHNWNYHIEPVLLPDNPSLLEEAISGADQEGFDLIITTGGTGIGKKDITIEVVKPMLKKEIPGIMEMIRIKYGSDKPNALLSRSIAGVTEKSLVYCLPGSVKAVREYMTEILKTLKHTFLMLHGIDAH